MADLESRKTLSGFQDGLKGASFEPVTSSNDEEDSYFSELLGYSVDRISKEPDLLRAEQDQLARRIQETSVANYRSFITASSCLKGLEQQLAEVSTSLQALDGDLPKLQAAAEAFRRDGAAANARRDAVKQLYANHAAVMELLEIPSLMDTCIRSGNFDEALDLRAYATKLAVVHGELPLVRRLLEDVASASAAMLEQLLERLQGNVQLPECLRVIGYLRRLSIYPEAELRLQFLQRREVWVSSLTADLDERSAYDFLKRLTDVYRLHLFDAIMQYRAIFADQQPHPGSGARGADDGGILYSWAERRVRAYLTAMEMHLPRITDGGGLASVLDHAMYCGASLGRVGMDFRPLLAPLFEAAALELFQQGVQASSEAFAGLLETHKWIAMPSAASRAAQLQRQQGGEPGGDGRAGQSAEALGIPPAALMEHAPLAVFANGLLAALNELRHCAPLSLRQPTASALQQALVQVATALTRHESARALSDAEVPVFRAACGMLTNTLCPYISSCFERVYAGGGGLLDLKAVAAELSRRGAD